MAERSIAIIPAKGRSRRLPGKNIRDFYGHPIISYPIRAALESGLFDTVMVSTDDPEIAEISRNYGAEVPFFRSAETCSDAALLYEVDQEVLREYEKQGQTYDWLCSILATAVFVTPELLRNCKQLLDASPQAQGLSPVVRYSDPIQRALQIDDSGRLSMVWPENMHAMSNDLPPRFHDAGLLCWMKVAELFRQNKLNAEYALGLEVPESEAVDLDTEEDWRMTEVKYQFFLDRQKASASR